MGISSPLQEDIIIPVIGIVITERRSRFRRRPRVACCSRGRRVAQTRVRRMAQSYSDLRETQSYSNPVWSLCFSFGREIRVLVETRPSCWSEARIWWLVLGDF